MAYTSAPETQTYSSQRLSPIVDIELIPGTTTATLQNGLTNLIPVVYQEDGKGEAFAETRPPIKATIIDAGVTTKACRGMHVWQYNETTRYYFAVFGVSVYTSSDLVTWTIVNTLTTSAITRVGFTEFIDDVNTKKLILVDGVEGYIFTSNAAGTKITDAQFPTPHVPFPVFLDGYIFLAKQFTGDIYNCELNDPSSWVAGDFISSEMYPDDVQALVRMENYIVAIGNLGCEFFYDNANPSGSPLQRDIGLALPFGVQPQANSLAYTLDTCVFLANTGEGDWSLKMLKGKEHKDITPPFLIPYINYVLDVDFTAVFGIWGFMARLHGKPYYVLNFLGGSQQLFGQSVAFMCSLETGVWTKLQAGTSGYWPVFAMAGGTNYDSATFVAGNTQVGTAGQPFVGVWGFSRSNTSSYNALSEDQFNGNSSTYAQNIASTIQFKPLDFGTLNQKQAYRFGIGFTCNATQDITSNFTVSWGPNTISNSPYTYSQTLPFNTTTDDSQFPFIYQMGRFRTLRLKVDYTGEATIRYRFFEIDINKGQH